jgi:hypothetical protein
LNLKLSESDIILDISSICSSEKELTLSLIDIWFLLSLGEDMFSLKRRH